MTKKCVQLASSMRQSCGWNDPTECFAAFIVTLTGFTATFSSGVTSGLCLPVIFLGASERHVPSFSLLVTLTVGMLQWNSEKIGIRKERKCYKETMRSQTRYEWENVFFLKREREDDELSIGKGQSVIKTQWRWREGMVIDCLVSPHAPVT